MDRLRSLLVGVGAFVAVSLVVGACGDDSGSDEAIAADIGASDVDASTTTLADAREGDERAGLEFETVAVVIDEEWPLDVMVPAGWHLQTDILGVVHARIRDHDDRGMLSGEPGDGVSVITQMEFDTGCDGTCAANDWSARLNGPEGWLTEEREGADVVRDEAITGGWVLIEDDRGDLEATVLRWEDGAPRYLECTVEIDDDDVALADQFVDACAAAVPDWSET